MMFRINPKFTKIFLLLFILLVVYPAVAVAVNPTEYWARKTVSLQVLQNIGGLSQDMIFHIMSFLPIDLEGWVSQALIRSAESSYSFTRGFMYDLFRSIRIAF